MKVQLNPILDKISMAKFGMLKRDAHAKGICIKCHEPAEGKCHSIAGKKEYEISALCEECFDEMFQDSDRENC